MSEPSLFAAGGRHYSRREILRAAAFRGDLAQAEAGLCEAIARQAAAEQRGESLDADVLQQASERFRAARGLDTAADTEAWLRARELDVDQFVDCLERGLWRQSFAARKEAPEATPIPPTEDLAAQLWPELVMGGAFAEFALRLARRKAVACDWDGTVSPESIVAERDAFLARTALVEREIPRWCAEQDCEPQWVEAACREEAAFQAYCAELSSPARLEQALRQHRFDLLMLEIAVMDFGTEDQAREAYWCLQEDGATVEETCAVAGVASQSASTFMDGLPQGLRKEFLSVAPGSALLPVRGEDGYRLHVLRAKTEPSLEYPAVAQRLTHETLGAHLAALVAKRIAWTGWLEP